MTYTSKVYIQKFNIDLPDYYYKELFDLMLLLEKYTL